MLDYFASAPQNSQTARQGKQMQKITVNAAGENQRVSIIQPFLTINFWVALQGLYPSRN